MNNMMSPNDLLPPKFQKVM
jgi:hypothetical protein